MRSGTRQEFRSHYPSCWIRVPTFDTAFHVSRFAYSGGPPRRGTCPDTAVDAASMVSVLPSDILARPESHKTQRRDRFHQCVESDRRAGWRPRLAVVFSLMNLRFPPPGVSSIRGEPVDADTMRRSFRTAAVASHWIVGGFGMCTPSRLDGLDRTRC